MKVISLRSLLLSRSTKRTTRTHWNVVTIKAEALRESTILNYIGHKESIGDIPRSIKYYDLYDVGDNCDMYIRMNENTLGKIIPPIKSL